MAVSRSGNEALYRADRPGVHYVDIAWEGECELLADKQNRPGSPGACENAGEQDGIF